MKLYPLAVGVTTSGVAVTETGILGEAGRICRYYGSVGMLQISGITTATVKLQGRLSADHGWEDLYTATADGLVEVPLMPHMRANVTAYTSGTIYVDLGVYLNS